MVPHDYLKLLGADLGIVPVGVQASKRPDPDTPPPNFPRELADEMASLQPNLEWTPDRLAQIATVRSQGPGVLFTWGRLFEEPDHEVVYYSDPQLAIGFYHLAWKDGERRAAVGIADVYAESSELPDHEKQALLWYTRASEEGFSAGSLGLAKALIDGRGVEADPERALALFQKAIDAGDARAAEILAMRYQEGEGVERDLEKAVQFYRKAASLGVDVLGPLFAIRMLRPDLFSPKVDYDPVNNPILFEMRLEDRTYEGITFPLKNAPYSDENTIILEKTPCIRIQHVEEVRLQPMVGGMTGLLVSLTAEGGEIIQDISKNNINRRMAIILDNVVLNASLIRSPLADRFVIGSMEEAKAKQIHERMVASMGNAKK